MQSRKFLFIFYHSKVFLYFKRRPVQANVKRTVQVVARIVDKKYTNKSTCKVCL